VENRAEIKTTKRMAPIVLGKPILIMDFPDKIPIYIIIRKKTDKNIKERRIPFDTDFRLFADFTLWIETGDTTHANVNDNVISKSSGEKEFDFRLSITGFPS
jgi:hypothetical protein